MSEQNTSEPNVVAPGPEVKDPRRVAAGKRLAEISRRVKELRLSQKSENTELNDKTICVASEILNITMMVGVLLIYKYVL